LSIINVEKHILSPYKILLIKILTSGVQINPELKEICERFIDYVANILQKEMKQILLTREIFNTLTWF